MNDKVWHRNLIILWFGAFMSEGAISLIVPIMPLFLKTLGNYSNKEINLLTGMIFSITFLIKAIISPLWGKISDQKGHKPMLLKAAGGLTFCCLLISIAPNIWIIFLARAIQGVFSGYINNSESMIAAQVPDNKNGFALGTLATGDTAGLLCGPIIGGILATGFGFRGTFIIAGLLMGLVFLLSLILVKENFQPLPKKQVVGILETMREQEFPKIIIIIFIITMIIQATNNAVNPIISLYLADILHNPSNLTLISGIISSIPGIATIMSATYFGHLGDRYGQTKLLSAALILGILTYIPQIFITNIWVFSFLRFLTGFSIAALLPAAQAILTLETDHKSLGRIFSYNQTFQAMGNVLGMTLSSIVSAYLGYSQMFLLVVILEIIGLTLVPMTKRHSSNIFSNKTSL
ncbi:MFS transporter [Companilactobacillus keshanensis]|uniref:MFS transporter n=1 Tax=Companilactobacillus keshanensis TaxID=2486003 RepID=A0ABW4BWE7_9LACO|nr:MFS transporter [Companilactobacillus keshanensis]